MPCYKNLKEQEVNKKTMHVNSVCRENERMKSSVAGLMHSPMSNAQFVKLSFTIYRIGPMMAILSDPLLVKMSVARLCFICIHVIVIQVIAKEIM